VHKARREVKEIIKQYKEVLQKLGVHVERVILYGSFVRGAQREDSDIDVVVISKDFQKMNLRERLEILGIAAARIMQPIEARGYTQEEFKEKSRLSFLQEVLTTGVSV